jgi:deazaflavin-dependent oxidoreductase (nitroreductase family)
VVYPVSGGRLLSTGPVIYPTLLLTTIGRRSGRPRTTPLFYVRDGPRLLLASSILGAWAMNLLEHPQVSVQIGRRCGRYLAREATDEERAACWPRFTAFWPAYDDYAQRSGRRFVYVLDPLTPGRPGA